MAAEPTKPLDEVTLGTAQKSAAVNPISKKLTKILESKIETDQNMLTALENASEFFTGNTLQKRRNLRRDLETKSLEANLKFLESFHKVKLVIFYATHIL